MRGRTNSDLLALVPANLQANGKYCVILWSKGLQKSTYKINFTNKINTIFVTDKELIVVLRAQINVYDINDFTLLLRKEISNPVLQSKLINQQNRKLLAYIEEGTGSINSRYQVFGDQ